MRAEWKKVLVIFCTPSSIWDVFGVRDNTCMYIWWWHSGMTEELVLTRNNPLVCGGMLLKNLPGSVVLCVTANNEMPCTFTRLSNTKETFTYLCLEKWRENQHQREPPT